MKRFPWRSLLYTGILLYLLVDLRWCQGPLYWKIQSQRAHTTAEVAAKNGWVAVVNQEPITRRQLTIALQRYLFQRGKMPEEIPEATLKMMKQAVVQRLINDTLIRQYADGEKFDAPQKEIDAFIESWESQFASPEILKERSDLQNLSKQQRDAELARIWSRKRWLEDQIEPGVDVTSEEVRQFFDVNHKKGSGFTEPEKVRARHIFVSTVEADDEAREKMIRDAYVKLNDAENPANFADLAKAISDDARSKLRGGDLNWFSRERMPKDFCKHVFPLEKGEISEPFKTSIGWHIVEVLDRQAERPVTFEEAADEIRAHLESTRREETIKVLIKKRRRVAKIELFYQNI